MTALQDWLGSSPVTPYALKAVIRDAWRGLTSDNTFDDESSDEPQLMGRGLERC